MSKPQLTKFLTKLHKELTKPGASEEYRTKTGNKLTHTVSISKNKITETLKTAITSATNVSGSGDAVLKEISNYTELLDNLIESIRTNFNNLRSKDPSNIKFVSGARSSPKIRVILFDSGKRDNFSLAQKQYKEALQTFYESILQEIGVVLERDSSSNKSGTVQLDTAGQIYNLEHFKSSSNIKSFINDSIHNALSTEYTDSELETLEADLKKLGLKTILAIDKNIKTGKAKVFLGSQADNVAQSSSEQALKKKLVKGIEKALKKLEEDLVKTKSSDSFLDSMEKTLFAKMMYSFRKEIPQAKFKQTNTKIKGNIVKATLDVSPTLKRGENFSANLNKKRVRKSAQKQTPARTPLQLLAILNKKLPDVVRKNMNAPALQNRTGRFADSVEITGMQKTSKGFPSIGYTYRKNPYQVFEVGKGSSSMATPERDPRKLIDRSIREIAREFAIGRFYTRRV